MAYIVKYTKSNGESGEVTVASEKKVIEKLEALGPCSAEIQEKE
jgi:hypothetical protein